MPRLTKEWYALCAARAEARAVGAGASYPTWREAYIVWDAAMKKAGLSYTRMNSHFGDYSYIASDGEKYLESEPL